jgi:hypothetical protein
MNRIKAILIGTMTGTFVGLSSTVLTAVIWLLLSGRLNTPGHWDGTVTIALLSFCLVQGGIIGGVNGSLCQALCNLEQIIISVLLSLAMGAVRVMAGGFGSQSLLPVAIFGLAFVNGGVTAVALLLVLRHSARIDERNLLIN